MEFETIKIERRGRTTWLTLNRPERHNAINATMLNEYRSALAELAKDNRTAVIVVRGAGRSFCAGYDISAEEEEIAGLDQRSIVEDKLRLERNIEIFMDAWRHPKPVIAAVHGYCLAGGTQLATLCDITVVAADAVIGMPALPLGGGYISPMWVPLVGPKRAKQMSFVAGSQVSGETAAAWGWANFSTPGPELFDVVHDLAEAIGRTPGELLTVKKAAINRAADIAGWSTIMPLGAETDALLHATASVIQLNQEIKQNGLKSTINRFDAGELDLNQPPRSATPASVEE
jgi:enoyl-CoA hydratase